MVPDVIRIDIEVGKYVPTGIKYRAYLDGKEIVYAKYPEGAACRRLRRAGIEGDVAFYHKGAERPYMVSTVQEESLYTYSETETSSIRRVKFNDYFEKETDE